MISPVTDPLHTFPVTLLSCQFLSWFLGLMYTFYNLLNFVLGHFLTLSPSLRMRNTSIWLHHFMRSQTFFHINHIWMLMLRSRCLISFPDCALCSFLWRFLPSLYPSLFSACIRAFEERQNTTHMLLVTIVCRNVSTKFKSITSETRYFQGFSGN